YTVTIAAGIQAQDGATMKSDYQWSFTTERPAITRYSFETWRSPGTPVVRLVFNQPVTEDSVRTVLHFGDQKEVLAEPDPFEREVFYVLPLPGEPGALVFPTGTPPVKSDDRPTTGPNDNAHRVAARRVWLVSPTRELPTDVKTELDVTPGLRSYAGALPGVERRTVVSFDTFPDFRFLGVRCVKGPTLSTLISVTGPTGGQPACNPFGSIFLVF